LAGNLWWESTTVKHLFPVGEVNGSHGVYRPGGSALNAGQVAGFRVADYIAARYGLWTCESKDFQDAARVAVQEISGLIGQPAPTDWRAEREELQKRMSRCAAHIRSREELRKAAKDAWAQWRRLEKAGCAGATPRDVSEAVQNRQLCFAHAVYIEAVRFAIESGVGSRGSCIVLDPSGQRAHGKLDAAQWSFAPENPGFRDNVQETVAHRDGKVVSTWVPRRPMADSDAWFETAWAAYRKGEIFK
jgi:aspartate oxidase